MDTRSQREVDILDALRKLKPEVERDAYLQGACANDPDLRASVEALYQAYCDEQNFISALTLPGAGLPGAPEERMAEGPGSVIGRYKLLEGIGEGGMGVVYMAEQEQPVRRRVALKIIKLGMDTKQVVARFEAER
jgi:hypothetical protein